MRSNRPANLAVAFVVGCILWSLGALSGGHSRVSAQGNQAQAAEPQVEEIYLVRSVRESRTGAPTEFCASARTNFNTANEDQYTLRSTATRAADGRIVDANAATVGSLHGCFGVTSDPANINFYAEGLLGSTPFKGIGECRFVKLNFPEPGIFPLRCFLELSGLPAQYVGGLLTTSSVNSSRILGMETEPRGYTQASIATIRLWKKRTER